MVEIKEYTLSQFRNYLQWYKDNGAILKCTFLHHTYIPNAHSWYGMRSMETIRRYHLQAGGRDIFCHAYASPTGTIFNGRPPSSNNCACQAPPKSYGFDRFPHELQELILKDVPHSKYGYGSTWKYLMRKWPNKYGFSIETVGCFDKPGTHNNQPPQEDIDTSIALSTSIEVLKMVHDIWDIPLDYLFFHRDVCYKTCPGNKITKPYIRRRMEEEIIVPDVSEWAQEDVELVKERGIMSGFPDGTFRGTEPVTREQLAIVSNNIVEYIKEEFGLE